jgi:hypothetical protein
MIYGLKIFISSSIKLGAIKTLVAGVGVIDFILFILLLWTFESKRSMLLVDGLTRSIFEKFLSVLMEFLAPL